MPDSTLLGFIVNPIAGRGGRVGLKGTDDIVDRAVALGATAEAPAKATETLTVLAQRLRATQASPAIAWLTCSGAMGADCLKASGFHEFEVVRHCLPESSAEDTLVASRIFLRRGVDLVLFCGGDGTARDICRVIGTRIPMLGIPAGVKMYSGVFGISPRRTAEIVYAFLYSKLSLREADVMDLDEERYRQGEWVVRLYNEARTPEEPSLTQSTKLVVDARGEAQIKEEIAAYVLEEMQRAPEVLWILGAGSTLETVGKRLGIQKSLLGIDAVVGMRLVAADLNEVGLLNLLASHPDARLVLSPIGAQGFVLGRGNSPLSPTVLRAIGIRNLVIVATPAKLARTPVLRFDTGDAELDAELAGSGYLPVSIGYGRRRLVEVAI